MSLLDQCTFLNLVCSAAVLAVSLVFVVDSAFREMNTLIVKARLSTFVTLAVQTALFTLEGDVSNSVASSALNAMYSGMSLITLLYFCEIFNLVYAELPSETSKALLKIVKLYPWFRAALLVAAAIAAAFISALANNAAQVAFLTISALGRFFCVIPTFVVMLRISLILRRNRVDKDITTKATKRVERQMMLFAIIAITFLVVTTAATTIPQLVDLVQMDPQGEWQRVCATTTAGGVARTLAFLIGIILVRAPKAQWKAWTPCVGRNNTVSSSISSRTASTTAKSSQAKSREERRKSMNANPKVYRLHSFASKTTVPSQPSSCEPFEKSADGSSYETYAATGAQGGFVVASPRNGPSVSVTPSRSNQGFVMPPSPRHKSSAASAHDNHGFVTPSPKPRTSAPPTQSNLGFVIPSPRNELSAQSNRGPVTPSRSRVSDASVKRNQSFVNPEDPVESNQGLVSPSPRTATAGANGRQGLLAASPSLSNSRSFAIYPIAGANAGEANQQRPPSPAGHRRSQVWSSEMARLRTPSHAAQRTPSREEFERRNSQV